jgi:uncharacterized membrane protein YdbT with pleckstrin-like domain
MKYIKSTLLKDETVVYYTGPHIIIFYPCFLWLTLFVASFQFAEILPSHVILAYLTLLLALFYALSCYINYISSEYGITNKRVLMKRGFIRRHSLEIFFHKVESISITQSILGRLLNYGTVIISGTGGSRDPFCFIPDPLAFRRAAQEQMEKFIQQQMQQSFIPRASQVMTNE